MHHKKFQVVELSPWTNTPPKAAEFYSRRAAADFVNKAPKDTKYEIVEVSVPAYVPHCGSPGVGDPELKRLAEGTPEPTVTAPPSHVGNQADEEVDGETFTFWRGCHRVSKEEFYRAKKGDVFLVTVGLSFIGGEDLNVKS